MEMESLGVSTQRLTADATAPIRVRRRPSLIETVRNRWALYVMLVPGLVWLVMFRYIPFSGSVIAFQDFQIFRGIWDSPWVGLEHFRTLLQHPDFYRVLTNTLILGAYMILFTFPIPIVLALLLNEVHHNATKKGIQTILYIPHFFSWVIIAGFAFQLLGTQGPVNALREWLGLEIRLFVQEPSFFRMMVTGAAIYRDAGWGTIVYLAAISGINPELYEAALMDGASRVQRMVRITFPLILPTAIILLLLSIGRFMNLGFERIFVFLTPMTYRVGDIFDTYVFRVGIVEGQYSLTTAVGLFQSLVGFCLVMTFNWIAKKIGQEGVY